MSMIYDNWERLVAAVLKREQLWQLFHAESRSPSISSGSSDFSFSFRLTSSLDDAPFSSPKWSAYDKKEEDDIGSKPAAASPSSILVRDQSPVEKLSPNKNVTSKSPWKRALKIQVPNLRVQHHSDSSLAPDSSGHCQNVSPGMRSPSQNVSPGMRSPSQNVSPRMRSPTPISRAHPRARRESQTNSPDDAKQESYPLPLPPEAISNSPPNSSANSAATSPSVPSRGLARAENLKSPGPSWRKGKLLGRGEYGDIYLGFNSERGEMCAMKEVKLPVDDAKSKQSAKVLVKEMALLSSLRHPNIVQYYGSEMVGDNLYIYHEYVSGGSIYMILQQYGKLGESVIRNYTQQILSALAYLHSKSIVHRDIRGANILVDPNGRAKFARFGIEKHVAGQANPSLLMDEPYWMAPEVIMNSNMCNQATDIWSLGCTVLEMATSKPPFSRYNWAVAMFKIGLHKELPTIPDHLSHECKDFLRHCLQWNPLHRATATELLEHPFVKSSSALQKQILVPTSSGHPAVPMAVKPEGIDHARRFHQLESGRLAIHPSGASKSNFHSSDIYVPRNISSPVSPVGSPLPHPRSTEQLKGRTSTPPTSSPHTRSGSSTSTTGGIGAIPYPHANQSMLSQETPKQSLSSNSPCYWDPNILRGWQSGSRLVISFKGLLMDNFIDKPWLIDCLSISAGLL